MNKITQFVISLFAVLAISGCIPTPNIKADKSLLSRVEPMEASGRFGFQFNQVIKFGSFETGKVKRGWTHSYNIPFIAQFKGAKEKLQFVQYGLNKESAEVFCISKVTEHYLPLIGDFFDIPFKSEDHFAGTIYQKNNNSQWDFIIYSPDGGNHLDTTSGIAKNGKIQIEIKGVREIDNLVQVIKDEVFGYEFFLDGKSIGAVQTVNNGRIWIDPTLSSEVQLVLASIATGVLLRSELRKEDDLLINT